MLTEERHSIIMKLLESKGIIRIQELVDILNTSESTVRRDLSYLEKKKLLKRIHGGASLLKQKRDEPSMLEKATKNLSAKKQIASYAASLIQDGDCIFLDAGTTTLQMIENITAKDITIVTNGIPHLEPLMEKGLTTYAVGGYVKPKTKAAVGVVAVEALKNYRFDKAFLGVNAIHLDYGYTTPDPEEAAVKRIAMDLGQKVYVLADNSKFNEVTFAKIGPLEEATIITNAGAEDVIEEFQKKTKIEVVKS